MHHGIWTYKDSGGGLVKPDKVASPVSGAMVLSGFWLNDAAGLISMIFLIRIHQHINEMM
jgi:hypothetical protein